MIRKTHFTLCLAPSRCSINVQGCCSCYSLGSHRHFSRHVLHRGPNLPHWVQLGFLCSRERQGLILWSSTLWAFGQKP